MAQLLRAAGNGDLDKVIQMRGKWDYANKKGETVLHIAIAEDQIEIVKYLVSNGIPLNVQDNKKRFTPLMLCLAVQPSHYIDMLQVLLKAKADVHMQDANGQTVLHHAAQYEAEEALELILRTKANVNALDAQKMTALHMACGKGNLDIVQLLVERGKADVNLCDGKKNSPLHWVCIGNGSNVIATIQYLISKGAKPLQNNSGNTPLHMEALHCDLSSVWPTDVAKVLQEHFTELADIKNINQLTAWQTFEQSTNPSNSNETEMDDVTESKNTDSKTSNPEQDNYQKNAAAAKAAAIARQRKKQEAKLKEKEENASNSNTWITVTIVLLAIILGLYISGARGE